MSEWNFTDFASKDNLLKAERPVFIEGKYTDRGKWMDGWESRRRRTPGHDFCIIRLGQPGVIRAVDVDTSFFKGNFPEACSIEACAAGAAAAAAAAPGAISAAASAAAAAILCLRMAANAILNMSGFLLRVGPT